jgi:hypothetical protein
MNWIFIFSIIPCAGKEELGNKGIKLDQLINGCS